MSASARDHDRRARPPRRRPKGQSAVTSRSSGRLDRERLLWGCAVAVVVALGYLVTMAVNRRFFYQDDTEGGAAPVWVALGERLRDGRIPVLDLDTWMAGNWTVEGQGGLWNPAQMLVAFIAPSVDQLALYAAAVKLVFAVILALGVYRTALEYGAPSSWAAVAGAAMPFTGFALYYDQATWVTGLFCSAWVAQAWASAVRYARGRSGPLPAFLFLYLAVSVGYVHGAIAAGLLVGCVLLGEGLAGARLVSLVRVAAVGAAAATSAVVTFLPALLTSTVTWRTAEDSQVYNDNFLTAPWSEVFLASVPSALPAIQGFEGEVQDTPVAYIAWFLVPLLAFVDWRLVAGRVRALATPLAFAAVMLVAVAGPSYWGPLRWPARLLPYLAMAVLVLAAVVLGRALTARGWRGRSAAAVALLVASLLRAGSSEPKEFGRHAVATLLVAALVAGVLLLWRWRGNRVAAGAVMLSLLPVLAFQVTHHPVNDDVNQWNFASSVSKVEAAFPDYDGLTLQLADYKLLEREDKTLSGAYDSLVFGNYARLLDADYVNAYTPVGHREFANLLCMNYAGSTCPAALDNVLAEEQVTGLPYVDLLAVDRLVIQREQYPDVLDRPLPAGWRWASVDDEVAVLERDEPLGWQTGHVAAAPGVEVTDTASRSTRASATVASPTGGTVVFSRLAWPGYTATLDGVPVPVREVRGIFLAVDVPPGTSEAHLEVRFEPPGLRLGLALMGFGLLVLLVLVVVDLRGRSRQRRTAPSSAPADAVSAAASGATAVSATRLAEADR